jgi:3-dehydroshikimate dehydratase
MLIPGLVSVTLRQLSAAEIVDLASGAGLVGIEWGGDIHVPPGDVDQAHAVRRMTEDAGLSVACYGSYYRVGDPEGECFEAILDTAVVLGAPAIRVWAGRVGSDEADEAQRRKVADDAGHIADMAGRVGIDIAFEYHGSTLTDTHGSAVALLKQLDRRNVKCLWQPPGGKDVAYCLEGLEAILPWLSNIHIYHRGNPHSVRLPLADGQSIWTQYLKKVAAAPGDRFAMLEFVKDDDPQQVREDASALISLLHLVHEDQATA